MSSKALSLTRLLIEERGDLLRFLRRQLDPAAAEDVAQTLYFKLLRVADDPPIINKKAFLFRLASNLATDYQRTESRLTRLRGEVQAWFEEPSMQMDTATV